MPRKKVKLTVEQLESIRLGLLVAHNSLSNLPFTAVKGLPKTLQSLIERAGNDCLAAHELFTRFNQPDTPTNGNREM